ncbi:hypothetical protein LG299_11020 [Microbacterium lacus]|uniref:hypothetical protein n=1 Tax=Microbacterium lacus TaxID=415217 RepID=UPI00384C2823
MSVPFDARPLTDPVDPVAVRSFSRSLRIPGSLGGAQTAITIVIVVVVGSIFVSIFAGMMAGVIASIAAIGSGTGASGVFGVVFSFVPMLLLAGAFVAIGFAIFRGFRGASDRRFRLDRFARANGMTYDPGVRGPALPGMIFNIGKSRQSTDLVRGQQPRFVEFGNYTYSTGSGKSRTTHQWGYVAVKLDVPLPHIVLDAEGNNSFFGSNLPIPFQRDQRLSLEGDFDRFFSLYCPAGYETDALYLFTPDIMARFIDNAAQLDVEIVDDWLFLYGKRQFTTLDPATWAWLFSAVAALLEKLAQWSRWRDDQMRADAASVPSITSDAALPFAAPVQALRPPPGVAAPGKRLKRGIAWPAIIVGGVILLFWAVPQVLGIFGWLLGWGSR